MFLNQKNLIALILFAVVLTSCSKDNSSTQNQKKENVTIEDYYLSAPKIDNSAPDKLLQSFYNIRIWSDTTEYIPDNYNPQNDAYSTNWKAKAKAHWDDRIKRHKLKHYLNESRIDKVETISDSRVTYYCSELEYDEDNSYAKLKYDFVKENGKWKIDAKFSECWNCTKGNGFSSSYDCKYCKGSGWSDSFR